MLIEKNKSNENELWRRFHHRHPLEKDEDKGHFYQLRQCLNLVFIILTIVGIVTWFTFSRDFGIYILIICVVIKFAESSLRIVKI